MEKVIVKLENYSKSYGKKVIIKHIDLEVYEGDFLTLLGSSGCGKTTILRSIAGIDEPTTGKIYIDGIDVTNVSPIKRPVNTLFQNYALFPNMTVEQNISFGLKMKKKSKEEINKSVKEMLELVKLNGYENRKPSELSGGEQQRVSIARGLINKPRVLLLDEPLSALDLKLRKQMQVELKMLQKQLGITFIYVTHNQEEALTMSDRIVVLRNGNIEQMDTPYNIYRHPTSKYVADFIGDSNIFPSIIESITNNEAILKINDSLVKIKNDNYKKGEKIILVLRPENFVLINKKTKFNCITASVLENIYNGSFTRLIMKMEEHINLKVNAPDEVSFDIGKELYLTWDDIIIIRDKSDEKK